jgi:U1 small nuclear ribonucleoprotein
LYGEVVFARVIKDLEGKSRGYGFVEFSNNAEFLSAFRQASGKFIRGKQINVDAEYARLNKSFRPMRLGGGLGSTRRSKGRRYQRYCSF